MYGLTYSKIEAVHFWAGDVSSEVVGKSMHCQEIQYAARTCTREARGTGSRRRSEVVRPRQTCKSPSKQTQRPHQTRKMRYILQSDKIWSLIGMRTTSQGRARWSARWGWRSSSPEFSQTCHHLTYLPATKRGSKARPDLRVQFESQRWNRR